LIFSFLKYVTPIWYFNIKPSINHCYFPSEKNLLEEGIEIPLDKKYLSKEAQKRDLAYRAFRKGFIAMNQDDGSNFTNWETRAIPIEDEYRFVRKNYNVVWVNYILFLRIISFNNPIKEFKAFRNTKRVKKESYHLEPIEYGEFKSFKSELLSKTPLVSVIIPTLNRYDYLKDVLADLENQTYKNIEVIIVDQSEPFEANMYDDWSLDIKFWYQKEKALWKARNDAINTSKGEFILLYDDDSRVDNNWIEEHIKCLDFFNADISSGVSLSTIGAKIPEHYSYFRWSDQIDTGNVLLKKSVFEKVGLFDLNFEKQRMGDGEYGMRTYLAGYKNISNPFAKRIHLKVGSGGLRQMGSWDGWRPKRFWSARPVPSILYYFRKHHGNRLAVYSLLKNIPTSIIPYRYKGSIKVQAISYLLSMIISPILICQVILSWKRASKMLKNLY
jgi:glycosyltransferase involved in cell wall biosynthesis